MKNLSTATTRNNFLGITGNSALNIFPNQSGVASEAHKMIARRASAVSEFREMITGRIHITSEARKMIAERDRIAETFKSLSTLGSPLIASNKNSVLKALGNPLAVYKNNLARVGLSELSRASKMMLEQRAQLANNLKRIGVVEKLVSRDKELAAPVLVEYSLPRNSQPPKINIKVITSKLCAKCGGEIEPTYHISTASNNN